MTDWIEHNGGPQPVADDVWVSLNGDPGYTSAWLSQTIPWQKQPGYRILNDHLIDAARLEGIRLGLEAAVKACQAQAEDFLSPAYAVDQPLSSVAERFACGRCADEISAINPETIAKEADNEPR